MSGDYWLCACGRPGFVRIMKFDWECRKWEWECGTCLRKRDLALWWDLTIRRAHLEGTDMPQGENLFVVNGKRRERLTCKKCGALYSSVNGQRRCIPCRRKRQRSWQVLHREERKAYDHAYYLRTRRTDYKREESA